MQRQPTKISQLIESYTEKQHYSKMLHYSKKDYSIELYQIEKFCPSQILFMYKSIEKKYYHNPNLYTEQFWFQNQLKVFIWILLAYSYQSKKDIFAFSQIDWIYFIKNFNNRPRQFFQFQANLIIRKYKKYKKWTPEQEQLLFKIIKQNKFNFSNRQIGNKWNLVARQLFIHSSRKYYRTAKQCRERWLNHLDPIKKHSKWSRKQDEILLRGVEQMGKKWSAISKLLKNTRTQHMVKNRYNAIIRQHSKINRKLKQEDIVKKILQVKQIQEEYQNQNYQDKEKDFRLKKILQQHSIQESEEYFPCLNKKDQSLKSRESRKNCKKYQCSRISAPKIQSEVQLQTKLLNFQSHQAHQTTLSQMKLSQIQLYQPKLLIQRIKHLPANINVQQNSNHHFYVNYCSSVARSLPVKIQLNQSTDLPFFEEIQSDIPIIPFHLDDFHLQSFISQCIQNPIFKAFEDDQSQKIDIF